MTTRGFSQRDAFGEPLVRTIRREACKGLPEGTQSESPLLLEVLTNCKFVIAREWNDRSNPLLE